MKRRVKTLALFFAAVVALYLGAFYGCESWRRHRGGWELHFLTDTQGRPSMVIYEAKLGISSVELLFLGEHAPERNLSEKVVCDRPEQRLPFGRIIYEDLTVLPGVVTFDLFGHEIELVPRVLIVNGRQIPWKSEMVIELSATNKPAQPPQPPKQWR